MLGGSRVLRTRQFSAETGKIGPTTIPTHTNRLPFTPTGAVTGIGSLPLTSAASAIQAVADFSPEVPFWPQLPQLSERERVIGQALGIVADLIEPRNEGYGYQVKEGRIDSLLEILHRSVGDLTSANAVGFGAFENALFSGLFRDAVAVKGQIEGRSRCQLICSTTIGLSFPIPLSLLPLHFMSRRTFAGRLIA